MKLLIAILVFNIICFTSSTISFGQKAREISTKDVRQQASVIIDSAQAFTDGDGVYIEWSTSREIDNLGFYVYRIEAGKRSIVDNRFVAGSGIKERHETLYGQRYSLFDANGTSQSQYVIEVSR